MTALLLLRADGTGTPRIHREPAEIRQILQGLGIDYERWPTEVPLSAAATQDEVLAAHAGSIRQLDARFGFASIDVVGLQPDHPDRAAARAKFLREHTHADLEARFFVAGSGTFYLHVDDQVLATVCTEGDLISVPARTKHWFDMGRAPTFRCIRFFTTRDGWVADFTGDEIASRLPDADRLAALLR